MRGVTLRWLLRLIALTLLLSWVGSALWHSDHRLPPGLHIVGSWENLPLDRIHFLHDLAAADAGGAPLMERQIDAELQGMVERAREIVVIDAGLFGDLPAAGPKAPRLRVAPTVAAALTDALLKARQDQPGLQVLILIDPASIDLSSGPGPLDRLRAAGIAVVPVDTGRLRAPNAAFLATWQLCCSWWSTGKGAGSWPNPIGIGPPGVAMGLWGRIAPYQRSHRQLIVTDDGSGGLEGMIFSRPLNAEAALHSATALRVAGPALDAALESEFAVAQFSGWSGGGAMQARAQRMRQRQNPAVPPTSDSSHARVASESIAGESLVSLIEGTTRHDSIDIAALYLCQRDLVRALLDAARRGVAVRLLLDPDKDGYGYDRSGLPNRVVASELVAGSDGAVRVRWYRTHGEQFSAGFILIRSSRRSLLAVGTADLSRRDLDDFNLAAEFIVDVPPGSAPAAEALTWFDTLWFNRASGGIEYSSDADVYADASQLRYWQYRLLEATGAAFD